MKNSADDKQIKVDEEEEPKVGQSLKVFESK